MKTLQKTTVVTVVCRSISPKRRLDSKLQYRKTRFTSFFALGKGQMVSKNGTFGAQN